MSAVVILIQTGGMQEMQAVDFTFVNLLAELYAESGRHADVLELIKQAEVFLCKEVALAVDLQVSIYPCSWQCILHFWSAISSHTAELEHDVESQQILLCKCM